MFFKKEQGNIMDRINEKEYKKIEKRINALSKRGIHAHQKRIGISEGMKEYIRMYRWTDLKDVIEL